MVVVENMDLSFLSMDDCSNNSLVVSHYHIFFLFDSYTNTSGIFSELYVDVVTVDIPL